jgi:hemerythrin-like domain-containing protein
MTEPMDAILAIHNAFRADMRMIDTAALAVARGDPAPKSTLERYHFFNEVLVWHAKGEELGIFPAVEVVAPDITQPYIMDHHGLDEAFEALDTAVKADDMLQIARAASAFRFHHDIHLLKEDNHLYRLVRQRMPIPDQVKAATLMSSTVPQDRFPEIIAWMFPLIGNDDRENMTRIWQMVFPAPAFENFKGIIHKAIGDDWSELVRRIPSLE